MEINNHNQDEEEEESINLSSEEAKNDHNQEKEDLLGVGRSHECVYCKRGFNTAQALGGHMNIHRKDRAKNKPSHDDQNLENPRFYYKIDTTGRSSNYQNHSSPSHEHHQLGMINRGTYFPGSKSLTTLCCNNHQREPSIDSKASLSLEVPSMIERKDKHATNQRDELDLELRLGYDS